MRRNHERQPQRRRPAGRGAGSSSTKVRRATPIGLVTTASEGRSGLPEALRGMYYLG